MGPIRGIGCHGRCTSVESSALQSTSHQRWSLGSPIVVASKSTIVIRQNGGWNSISCQPVCSDVRLEQGCRTRIYQGLA
eukprot:12889189-Prorocentrum_lima.AAC.1